MTEAPETPEQPGHMGHRQRLRERFARGGPDALADYEVLELLLFHANARQDMKPVAKRLIERFGSLGKVVTAPAAELEKVKGVGPAVSAIVKAAEAVALRMLREQAAERPVLSSWDRVLDYCTAAMAYQSVEHFRLLFLDRKNKLIADEVQQRGTVDHTPVYPREVVKRALELGGSAIILVHNHPSGDPTPSRADIEMTRQVREAAEKLGIALHDHLVIGAEGHASMRALGLL